jgi:hypothetical protein
MEINCKKEEVEVKEKWFHPFYLYTVINGMIRVSEVRSAEVVGNNVGVRVYLKGYYDYSLVLYRLQSNFFQNRSSERIKKYLMVNL